VAARSRLLTAITEYDTFMTKSELDKAFRVQLGLRSTIEGFIKVLVPNFALENATGSDEAIASLREWLDQLSTNRATLDQSKNQVIGQDRAAGKFIYKEPALSLAEAEPLMDSLRQGQTPTLSGLVIPDQMRGNLARANEVEWGMGTIQQGNQEEVVIIAGAADATPFSEFESYLKPRAHTHPIKPLIRVPEQQTSRRTIPAKLRAASAKTDAVFTTEKVIFATDLLPSADDLRIAMSAGVPHTVFVNYKYDAENDLIINPAAIQDNTDISQLPWINFVIKILEPSGEQDAKPEVEITLKAGEYARSWRKRNVNSKQWWLD
jgi:hypothetical protein